MYQKGDLILYGGTGVCRVTDIVAKKFSRAEPEKLFYILTPLYQTGTITTPVDNGKVFTLADFAFGVASNFDRDVFVSSGADVHFLAPSRGKILRAEARQLHGGRRTCVFRVAVTDDRGEQVAYLTIRGVRVRKRNGR